MTARVRVGEGTMELVDGMTSCYGDDRGCLDFFSRTPVEWNARNPWWQLPGVSQEGEIGMGWYLRKLRRESRIGVDSTPLTLVLDGVSPTDHTAARPAWSRPLNQPARADLVTPHSTRRSQPVDHKSHQGRGRGGWLQPDCRHRHRGGRALRRVQGLVSPDIRLTRDSQGSWQTTLTLARRPPLPGSALTAIDGGTSGMPTTMLQIPTAARTRSSSSTET